jgi:hypothetical protein
MRYFPVHHAYTMRTPIYDTVLMYTILRNTVFIKTLFKKRVYKKSVAQKIENPVFFFFISQNSET